MGYRVKTVSAMTGIPRGTLLAWERRHDIVDPSRSIAGYREYSDADVALFRRLKALVDRGHPISEAVELARSRPELAAQAPEPPGAAVVSERILGALLRFDRAAADRLLPRLGQVPFAVAIDELFAPLLALLGAAWERGEVTIAQEHFVSGFCREHLLAMYHGLGGGPEAGVTVACATPAGERHELGLLILALKLALSGHRVIWLGADLPLPDLCAYLSQHQPRFVCLSFTQRVDRAEMMRLAAAVRAGAAPSCTVVFGGPGVAAYAGSPLDGVYVCTSPAELEGLVSAAVREVWRGELGVG